MSAKIREVSVSDLESAYKNQYTSLGRLLLSYNMFYSEKEYISRNVDLHKICFELRGEQFFLAFENSLVPYSVLFSDLEWINKTFGDLKNFNNRKKTKDAIRLKEMKKLIRSSAKYNKENPNPYKLAAPISLEKLERHNELKSGIRIGKLDKEIVGEEFFKLQKDIEEYSYIRELNYEITKGKLILCKLVS